MGTGASGRTVESRDPATGAVWRAFDAASPADVKAAVARARTAAQGWRATPLATRLDVLRRFHDVLFERRHEVASLITRENGKPAGEALAAEIVIALDFSRYYAAEAPRFLKSGWFTPGPLALKRKRVRIGHDPYGVIALIAPWNYPFMLPAGVLIPALITGNAVVLKPSEYTPSCGAVLADLFADAGLPPDVLQLVQGDGATGAAVASAAVDKVFFIGSVATGRKVAVACAERLVPCSLELGGSDAAIVLADADVDHAARGIAWGRFSNAGQTCVAPKRVFVEAPAYDAFVAALSARVANLDLGPGADATHDVGPVIHPNAAKALEAQRADAILRGATVAAEARSPAPSGGAYVTPTVLTNVPADARVLTEETFGPLLPVVKVASEAEAIARANDSPFGLSASVWTRDAARGVRVAERIEAGTVAVNDAIIVAGMAEVPHGGVKQSGIGRSHGRAGLEECVQSKTVVTDVIPGMRQAWWFGYSERNALGIDGFVRLAHGPTLRDRFSAIGAFLKLLVKPDRPS
jgi:succinate-semialdehyde dehydrogenase/glutarate-semialdehyde dehydrogenase